jgi:hypothetical protein
VLFFGHIAISVALADATESDPMAAVAGNLLPDVVDKTGGWVLKVMPGGRWLAHGLPFFLAANLLAKKALSERAWRGFALGYASHMVADLYAGGRLPLLAPFGRPAAEESDHGLRWLLVNLVPEVPGVIYLLGRYNKKKAEAR